MNDREQFRAYRALLGDPGDVKVHWWYAGTMMAYLPGLPAMPVTNATTLMIYRLETTGAASFAIHWDEVGYFSDYVSGELATQWSNPVTGATVQLPRNFQEGPARFDISRRDGGVHMELQQAGARIKSLDLSWSSVGKRVQLIQTERKVRGFPEQDGRLPEPGSAAGFEACTRLVFFGELDAARGEARDCHGIYDFELAGLPPWLGFGATAGKAIVSGIIRKTRPGEVLHARADQTLRRMFPDFYRRHVDG